MPRARPRTAPRWRRLGDRRAHGRLCPGSQPGEQVVLREWRAGPVGDPDEVLVAERLLRDLGRELAEPRGVDLAAVRELSRALALKDRADVDRRGDARLGLKSPLREL